MLTVKESAERLGVSPRLVYRFIEDRRLHCIRKGPRTILVRPGDLKRFAAKPRLSGAAGHKKNQRRVLTSDR